MLLWSVTSSKFTRQFERLQHHVQVIRRGGYCGLPCLLMQLENQLHLPVLHTSGRRFRTVSKPCNALLQSVAAVESCAFTDASGVMGRHHSAVCSGAGFDGSLALFSLSRTRLPCRHAGQGRSRRSSALTLGHASLRQRLQWPRGFFGGGFLPAIGHQHHVYGGINAGAMRCHLSAHVCQPRSKPQQRPWSPASTHRLPDTLKRYKPFGLFYPCPR